MSLHQTPVARLVNPVFYLASARLRGRMQERDGAEMMLPGIWEGWNVRGSVRRENFRGREGLLFRGVTGIDHGFVRGAVRGGMCRCTRPRTWSVAVCARRTRFSACVWALSRRPFFSPPSPHQKRHTARCRGRCAGIGYRRCRGRLRCRGRVSRVPRVSRKCARRC